MRTRLVRSTSTLMRRPRCAWGGHELRGARGRDAFAVPPLALAGGGSPGSETAPLRSCPPHSTQCSSFAPPLGERDDALGRVGGAHSGSDPGLLQELSPF